MTESTTSTYPENNKKLEVKEKLSIPYNLTTRDLSWAYTMYDYETNYDL